MCVLLYTRQRSLVRGQKHLFKVCFKMLRDKSHISFQFGFFIIIDFLQLIVCLILKENNGEKEREIYKNLSNTHYYHGYLDYCKS